MPNKQIPGQMCVVSVERRRAPRAYVLLANKQNQTVVHRSCMQITARDAMVFTRLRPIRVALIEYRLLTALSGICDLYSVTRFPDRCVGVTLS